MKKQIFSLAAGAALVFAAQSSFAGSAPAGDFDYQVILTGGCTVTTAASGLIPLGTQASYAGDILGVAAGSVVVKCSNMAYGICVNGGTNPDSGNSTRRLTDGTNFLSYDLKVDLGAGAVSVGDNGCNAVAGIGADTAAWANPIGGAVTVGPPVTAGLTGTGADQTYNLTADVTIPVTSVPGTYVDNTVLLTVIW